MISLEVAIKKEPEVITVKEVFRKTLSLGLGLALASKEQIEKTVAELVKKGEVSATESKELMDELIKKGEDGHRELRNKIREHVKEFLYEMDIPTKEDLKNLESRLEKLERRE